MNININDYIPTHKYIRLYENEEDYNEDVNNHVIDECAYSLVNKNNNEVEQEYTPSTRTTNNDNLVKFNYFDKDKINLWAGLAIIWGYFGFQKTIYELDGEQLIGGNFTFIKSMTVVKEIPDGYTLQHLNSFLRYATSTMVEIQFFDTTNIKAASYVFYKCYSSTKINADVLKNWKNLKEITGIFSDSYSIYNNLNDGDIVNFSSLKTGFTKFISQYSYIYNASSQFNKLIKFQFGNLLDDIFDDFISYSIVKILHSKNINEYTFSEYILNLNKDGCKITHYIPIYDNFIYNFDNELNAGFSVFLYTDMEDTIKQCNVTFNISNCGNRLRLLNEHQNYHVDIRNIYTINFNNNPNFNYFEFSYIDDNNLILNVDINEYIGHISFSDCNIHKNITCTDSDGGVISRSTVIGNIYNIYGFYTSTITGNVFITNTTLCPQIYNTDITGNVTISSTTQRDGEISNSSISGFLSIYNRNNHIDIKGTTINIININEYNDLNINNCNIDTFSAENIKIQSCIITIDNCTITNDIDLSNINTTKTSYINFTIKNITKNLNFNSINVLTIDNCVSNINIKQSFRTNNNNLEININNSAISFNKDINGDYINSINIINSFSYNNNNDYIIDYGNINNLYVYRISINYNNDSYDYNEVKPFKGIARFVDINSNLPIYDVYGCNITANLSNQNYVNLYCNNLYNSSNGYPYFSIKIDVNSNTITTANIYLYNLSYYKYNTITNEINIFDFSKCININTISIHYNNYVADENLYNTKFNFTNCINLDSNNTYNILNEFGSKYKGYHTLYIENNVYDNFTEEQIDELVKYYVITVVHQ